MAVGWIKIHRQLKYCWVWDNPLYLKAWLYILLTANHQESKISFDGKIQIIGRGQFITSQRKLADAFGCSVKTVRDILKMMESDNMIRVETDSKKTLLAVVNYDLYQLSETPSNTPSNTVSNTSGNTQGNTPSNTSTSHKQECINNVSENVCNNVDNVDNLLIPPLAPHGEPEQKPKKKSSPTFEFDFDSVLEGYTWTSEMKALVKSFFTDYRKAIKKPYKTEWGIKKQLKAIEEEISVSGEGFVEECINETMRNEWEGIFFNRDRKRKSTKQEHKQESTEEYLQRKAMEWGYTPEGENDFTGNTEIIDSD